MTHIATETDERTLPAHAYTDAAVLAEERERIFFRSWQFACHASELANPGSFVTLSIFDQDVIVLRDATGEMRAFYNVCQHRGHRLLDGSGQCRHIVCPYHAWTYTLDGRLKGARGLSAKHGPTRHDIHLTPVRVDVLLDFVFVNLDDNAAPLGDLMPGLASQIRSACPDIQSYLPADDSAGIGHSYECDANWKGLVDNYLECYHCDSAHPSFKDMMDIPNSTFEIAGNFTFQTAPTALKPESAAFPLNLEHDVTTGHFWWLFPNTMLGQFPGVPGFYISRLDPMSPDRTSRKTLSLVPREWPDADAQRRNGLRAEWTENIVSAEDRALCESVQRGMHQRGFDRGWYIVAPDAHGISEHAMRHFHKRYRAAMNGV